jgi:ATP-dependent Zn protease
MPVQIMTPDPDVDARKDILAKLLSNKTLASDVNLDEIAMRTERFTGSNLKGISKSVSKIF